MQGKQQGIEPIRQSLRIRFGAVPQPGWAFGLEIGQNSLKTEQGISGGGTGNEMKPFLRYEFRPGLMTEPRN